jgi:hypothetical protein
MSIFKYFQYQGFNPAVLEKSLSPGSICAKRLDNSVTVTNEAAA